MFEGGINFFSCFAHVYLGQSGLPGSATKRIEMMRQTGKRHTGSTSLDTCMHALYGSRASLPSRKQVVALGSKCGTRKSDE